MVNELILPDSRMTRRDYGVVMGDLELPSGLVLRVEWQPIFCANCGKMWGYVTRENVAFDFHLCAQCFERYGLIAGTYAEPDEEFCRRVAEELMIRFGPGATEADIIRAKLAGNLGPALEALERDSPYGSRDKRPRE